MTVSVLLFSMMLSAHHFINLHIFNNNNNNNYNNNNTYTLYTDISIYIVPQKHIYLTDLLQNAKS